MIHIDTKPDVEESMDRIDAWFAGELLDRPPVRFNAWFAGEIQDSPSTSDRAVDMDGPWATLKDRWFDEEYQVERFEKSIEGVEFIGETFPVYWPNLGPNIYAAMLGGEVEYGDVTTWSKPVFSSSKEHERISFSKDNEYLGKLEGMTRLALERGKGKYFVGYTDIHGGIDCADALLGTEQLLMDMYDEPEAVSRFVEKCSEPFEYVFRYFDKLLKEHGQPSVTWINIPSRETFHIPGPDLSSMMSREFFREFVRPALQRELKVAKHNLFHMDGKGVATHVDDILEIPELNGIQWVQGVGEDRPIMQWCGLIKKIQDAGKGVVVDLLPEELDEFMEHIRPKGIYLCVPSSDNEIQKKIIQKLLRWR